jgi:hypothetical protein
MKAQISSPPWVLAALVLLDFLGHTLATLHDDGCSQLVSLGLYSDSRTQGGGKLNMIARDKGKTTEDKERT